MKSPLKLTYTIILSWNLCIIKCDLYIVLTVSCVHVADVLQI